MNGEIMIIKYDIQKKYAEPEIHICSDVQNMEAKAIYDAVNDLFEQKIRAYPSGKDEAEMVCVADIIRVFTANKQVYISTGAGQLRIKERMYEMEEMLKGNRFVRISNSEIVNVRKIKRLDTSITGTIKMQLKGDIETYVSRRYVTKIKQMLSI